MTFILFFNETSFLVEHPQAPARNLNYLACFKILIGRIIFFFFFATTIISILRFKISVYTARL